MSVVRDTRKAQLAHIWQFAPFRWADYVPPSCPRCGSDVVEEGVGYDGDGHRNEWFRCGECATTWGHQW